MLFASSTFSPSLFKVQLLWCWELGRKPGPCDGHGYLSEAGGFRPALVCWIICGLCRRGVCVDCLMWCWCYSGAHTSWSGGSSLDGILSPLAWKSPWQYYDVCSLDPGTQGERFPSLFPPSTLHHSPRLPRRPWLYLLKSPTYTTLGEKQTSSLSFSFFSDTFSFCLPPDSQALAHELGSSGTVLGLQVQPARQAAGWESRCQPPLPTFPWQAFWKTSRHTQLYSKQQESYLLLPLGHQIMNSVRKGTFAKS